MSNVTTRAPQTGYDLPVYGLAEGLLLHIHVPALFCITLSLACAVATVAWSVYGQASEGRAYFFDWTQGERNIVYLAVCDGCFNLAHLFDHAHYLLTADHVQPVWLCKLYAFVISEFICAQHLLVNLIAVGACVTIHRERTVDFGRCDWKSLLYTFGGSFLIDLACLFMGAYGPTGSFCYFDPVAGILPHFLFSLGPLLLLFSMNVLLYGLTYRKIHQEVKKNRAVLGERLKSRSVASTAARTSMLFVAAFFIQWWASVVWGLWSLIRPPPLFMHQIATTFCNLGGVLNFGVFFILRRRRRRRQAQAMVRQPRTGSRPGTTGCRPSWLRLSRGHTSGTDSQPANGVDGGNGGTKSVPQHRPPRVDDRASGSASGLPATIPMFTVTPLSPTTRLSATTRLSPTTRLSATTRLSPTTRRSATTPQSATTPLPATTAQSAAKLFSTSTPLSPTNLVPTASPVPRALRISPVSPRYGGRQAAPQKRLSLKHQDRPDEVRAVVTSSLGSPFVDKPAKRRSSSFDSSARSRKPSVGDWLFGGARGPKSVFPGRAAVRGPTGQRTDVGPNRHNSQRHSQVRFFTTTEHPSSPIPNAR